MRRRALDFLRCPLCGGRLELSVWAEENDYIEKGSLGCSGCGHVYPVADGTARMLPAADLSEWPKNPPAETPWRPWPEDEKLLCEETLLDYQLWRGKTALEACCARGRRSLAALSLGAEVVALGCDERLRLLAPQARENPRLHLVEADPAKPPFAEKIFDVVFSRRALDRRDGTEVFRALSKTVRRYGRTALAFRPKPEAAKPPLSGAAFFWARANCALCGDLTARIPPERLRRVFAGLEAAWNAVSGQKGFAAHPQFRVRFEESLDEISGPAPVWRKRSEVERLFKEAGFFVEKIRTDGFSTAALARKL